MYAYMHTLRRQMGQTHVTTLELTAHAHHVTFKTNAAICWVIKELRKIIVHSYSKQRFR